MNPYVYREHELHIEGVSMRRIAAETGTPCFVCSRAALEEVYRSFDGALRDADHLIRYAVKANSNLAILNLFARLGTGFDIARRRIEPGHRGPGAIRQRRCSRASANPPRKCA